MKRILVPTDFTELGDYAYNVAAFLAEKTQASLTILSVLPGPVGASYSAGGELLAHGSYDAREWASRLVQLEEKMTTWTKGKSHIAETICTIGDVEDTIIRYSNVKKMDLIVMGTAGLSTRSMWSRASHTEYVSNHAKVPVLALKSNLDNPSMNHIVFVSDFLENVEINMDCLKKIQSAYDAQFVLLRIKKSTTTRADEKIIEDIHKFAKTNALDNYRPEIYAAEDIELGIEAFCKESQVDLVAVGTKQAANFSNLFARSVSDDLVNYLQYPVLTFTIRKTYG